MSEWMVARFIGRLLDGWMDGRIMSARVRMNGMA